MPTPCRIEDCGRPHQARGLCLLHYKRWQSTGDPTKSPRRQLDADAIEDTQWMADAGESLEGAAARLGVTPSTLERYLERHGHRDLAATLRRRNRTHPKGNPAA